jgi:hypothetical protein
MKIVGKNLCKVEFKQYVEEYNFGSIPPNRLCLHHTWRPTVKQWNGQQSILGLKEYYESKGWSAAPHIFIAPDGIWLFTPLYDVGIHAGRGNATYQHKITKKKIHGYIEHAWYRKFYNLLDYSIGIEMVGDYDHKKPKGKILDQTLFVLKTLKERLNLNHDAIHFHRDYSTKSCPGHAVTKEWIYKELERYGKPKPVTSVPKYFKQHFVWDQDEHIFTPEQYEELMKFFYRYHKSFHDKR